MKTIIPVAGIGTRLRPHTHTVPKVLIPVAGKPILGHILDKLKQAGNTDIILITGYKASKVEEYIRKSYNDLNVEFIMQPEREGLGHAIYLAKDKVGANEEILIILGDTILDVEFDFLNKGITSIGVHEVEDPKRFGVVKVTDGLITDFIEKPDTPVSNLAIVGIYFIKDSAELFLQLDNLVKNNIRTKGEFQLTDALSGMLKSGIKMNTFSVPGWYDCGKPETLLETNRILLEKKHNNPKLDSVIIINPCFIPESAKIKNSIIGPYVSVGENVIIENSIIQNSILNNHSEVRDILLNNSLIGENAYAEGFHYNLNVGDSSELRF